MHSFRRFQKIAIAGLLFLTACTPASPTPHSKWDGFMMHLAQHQAYELLTQIHAAPQPAAAKDLLAPTITLLIRGRVYKDAQDLAGLAINTFPKDPLYHHLLGEAYQAAITDGDAGSRIAKKMTHEFDLAATLRSKTP